MVYASLSAVKMYQSLIAQDLPQAPYNRMIGP
jgi:hypothetical protein